MSPNYKAIAEELRKHFPGGRVELMGGGAAPVCVLVIFGDADRFGKDDERFYVLGEANATWGGEFYDRRAAFDAFEPTASVDSHLSTCHVEPWTVALNLAAAVSRQELEGAEVRTSPPPPRCPECSSPLTDRTTHNGEPNGQPTYCDECDREVRA